VRDTPWMVLTRHFLSSLFDFGFLSEAGADSFKRMLMGSAAVAMGLGLLLVRVFMAKYANLSAGPTEAYQLALTADHAFLVAVPMWIVAAALVVAGHSLFPDETDYRILMAEPLPRHVIFGAKLMSLLLFGALFIGGAHVALLPMFLLTLLGQPGLDFLVASAAAFAVSSAAASLCSALAIVAIHGVLMLFAPRARVMAVAAVIRGALMAALVLSLPFLMRLPGTAAAFGADAWWLRWAPPAWFVGLERWLLGDVAYRPLAIEGIAATLMALAASVGSYVVLYRRFDRVTLRPAASHAPLFPAGWRARGTARHPVRMAIGQFVAITLRRSQLHQGIIVAVLAMAAGLVMNGALESELPRAGEAHARGAALPWITVWAPMTLIFIGVPAVRLALSVPIDLRANWVFRMTEDGATRADAIAAGVRTVVVLGVALPVVLVAPLQWWSLGSRTVLLIALECLVGWVFAELLMREWRRIPFTCTYLPGKGFVPHMVPKGIAAYLIFTGVTHALLRRSVASAAAMAVAVLALGAVGCVLSSRRRRHAGDATLSFEDEAPTDVTPLRLNPD
jgi:hypothetical protein